MAIRQPFPGKQWGWLLSMVVQTAGPGSQGLHDNNMKYSHSAQPETAGPFQVQQQLLSVQRTNLD